MIRHVCASVKAELNSPRKGTVVQAITVQDRAVGAAGLTLSDIPHPHAAENDVIVRVHAAGFTPGELDWRGTWTNRAGRDRTPSVPGHELSGVVTELGYGTTGLTVGQRVFGLADWTRDGSLAEYTAVKARNLAPLPAGIDHTVAAALAISGLTAWQALFDHAHLKTGQTVLVHGAAGGVGSIAVQLAHELGARVIGTGRAREGYRPSRKTILTSPRIWPRSSGASCCRRCCWFAGTPIRVRVSPTSCSSLMATIASARPTT